MKLRGPLVLAILLLWACNKEAEGVKVYDDVLYLGYATKHSSDTRRMVTIFKYDILKK